MVPVMLWSLLLIIFSLIQNQFENGFITSFFGLIGFGWILPFSLPSTPAIDHLWYVTVILLCYLMVPVLDRLDKKVKKQTIAISYAALVILQIILINFKIQLVFFLQFLLGYIIAKRNVEITHKKVILSAAGMFTICALRIILRRFSVNEVLYAGVIAEWSENLICLFVFFLIAWISNKKKAAAEAISRNAVVKKLDKMSCHLYITHYAFLHGMLCVAGLNISSKALELVVFLILTVIASWALYVADAAVSKHITKNLWQEPIDEN